MTLFTALLVLLLSNGCSGCGDGCTRCAGISNLCIACRNGYWLLDNRCMRCPDNCKECTNYTYCSKCEMNFWGTGTCNKQCPESCDESGCEYETGQCYRCLPGFYGTSCLHSCALCKDGLCNMSDGQCMNGCMDGYYGDTANAVKTCRKCSDNCILCGSQAICSECDKGFYRLSDENVFNETLTVCYPCLPVCEDCNAASTCTVCFSGTYGSTCQYNCSNSHCHRCNEVDDVDTCTECVSGYYLNGNSCVPETICSPNCVNDCYQNSLCVGGCKDGWSGQTCTVQCASQCQTCHQHNGTLCTKCKGDYFMSSCNNPCNEQCVLHSLEETCRFHDGFCLNGCIDGYWGDTCNNSCYVGCKSQCSQTDASCAKCHRNYYGAACEHTCNEHCVDNGSLSYICETSSGSCVLGCEDGYVGVRCDETINTGRTTLPTAITENIDTLCNKPDNETTKIQFLFLGIGAGVGISLMVVAGIGLCITRRRKRLRSDTNNAVENIEHREYENTSVGMRVMPSTESDYFNNSQGFDQPAQLEASLNVYERLQNDKREDQQQYSELGRQKDRI